MVSRGGGGGGYGGAVSAMWGVSAGLGGVRSASGDACEPGVSHGVLAGRAASQGFGRHLGPG